MEIGKEKEEEGGERSPNTKKDKAFRPFLAHLAQTPRSEAGLTDFLSEDGVMAKTPPPSPDSAKRLQGRMLSTPPLKGMEGGQSVIEVFSNSTNAWLVGLIVKSQDDVLMVRYLDQELAVRQKVSKRDDPAFAALGTNMQLQPPFGFLKVPSTTRPGQHSFFDPAANRKLGTVQLAWKAYLQQRFKEAGFDELTEVTYAQQAPMTQHTQQAPMTQLASDVAPPVQVAQAFAPAGPPVALTQAGPLHLAEAETRPAEAGMRPTVSCEQHLSSTLNFMVKELEVGLLHLAEAETKPAEAGTRPAQVETPPRASFEATPGDKTQRTRTRQRLAEDKATPRVSFVEATPGDKTQRTLTRQHPEITPRQHPGFLKLPSTTRPGQLPFFHSAAKPKLGTVQFDLQSCSEAGGDHLTEAGLEIVHLTEAETRPAEAGTRPGVSREQHLANISRAEQHLAPRNVDCLKWAYLQQRFKEAGVEQLTEAETRPAEAGMGPGVSREQQVGDDDNSVKVVAVKNAFMTSTLSSMRKTSAYRCNAETWSYSQILEWVGLAIDGALTMECRSSGAKAIWVEWAIVEENVPDHMQTSFVKFIDAKLSSGGFPSLQDLVAE